MGDLLTTIVVVVLGVGSLLAVLGADTPVAHSDGRIHPVDLVWASMGKQDRVPEAMAALVGRALREQTGDLLVFLPGIGEIRRVQSLLEPVVPPNVDVYPLAGALSLAEQDHALQPSPPGRRRVVLSTDIAESSLTVDGVRVVVDAGLARVRAEGGIARIGTKGLWRHHAVFPFLLYAVGLSLITGVIALPSIAVVAMVEPVGLDSARVKVSLVSTRVSPRMSTLTVLAVSPAANVSVPAVPV